MYAEYMRYHGLRVIVAATAREALEAADRAHVVVTGILLPGDMDGIELLTRLRADERTAAIPLVVVTACSLGAHRHLAELAGCDLFLPKPCLPDDLTREVRRLLEARSGRGWRRPGRRGSGARLGDRPPKG